MAIASRAHFVHISVSLYLHCHSSILPSISYLDRSLYTLSRSPSIRPRVSFSRPKFCSSAQRPFYLSFEHCNMSNNVNQPMQCAGTIDSTTRIIDSSTRFDSKLTLTSWHAVGSRQNTSGSLQRVRSSGETQRFSVISALVRAIEAVQVSRKGEGRGQGVIISTVIVGTVGVEG